MADGAQDALARVPVSVRPIILLDVDGPLTAGFFAAACRELQAEQVYVTPGQLTKWSFFEALGVSAEVERRVRTRLQRPGVATGFEPNQGARSFLSDLREWAEVYAVTSPLDGSPTWAFERESWLADRLGFDGRHVISARDKKLIQGDVFVDDKLEHLVEWSRAHPRGLAVMWTCPHNRADDWLGPRATDYDRLDEWLCARRVA